MNTHQSTKICVFLRYLVAVWCNCIQQHTLLHTFSACKSLVPTRCKS
jgi:hypothetical protein